MEGLSKSEANLTAYTHHHRARMLVKRSSVNTALCASKGKVVELMRGSVHVIVLGFSSAMITDANIRNEFKYKPRHGQGVYVSRYHMGHVTKNGAMIHFVVKSLDEETLHISGSLLLAHTGSVRWLDKCSVGVATDSNEDTRTDEEVKTQEQVSKGGNTSFLDR